MPFSKAPTMLRKYQERAAANVVAQLPTNPILVAPTGSGKTVMGAKIIRKIKRKPVWVAHRRELITQAKDHLRRAHVPALVTSIQKKPYLDLPSDIGVALIDECHHTTEDGIYRPLFDLGIPVIGITATPFRTDGRGLGNGMFGSLVVSTRGRELVDLGFLQAPTIYSHPGPDLTGVPKNYGDFNNKELGRRVTKPRLVADIVKTYKQQAMGYKTLAFAVNIAHSKMMVEAFNSAGILAEHVDAKTPKSVRDAIFYRLETGATAVVSNVGIATEGFDLPSLDCAIIARPTMSLLLWIQMAGRIMRPEGCALILDHAGCVLQHGSPLRHIDYTLDDTRIQRSEALGLKMCKQCYLMVLFSAIVCPGCDLDMSPVSEFSMKVADGDLIEFADKEAVWRAVQNINRYHEITGEWPIIVGGDLIEPVHGNKPIIYEYFLRKGKSNNYNPGWASHQYRKVFGVWPTKFVRRLKRKILT